MKKFIQLLTTLVLCCALSGICFADVFALQVTFSLNEVQTKMNRTFEVTLSARGCDDIAAFVCNLSFDGDAMEYKGHALASSDMQAEVNSHNKGSVKAVLLCEDSVDCSDETILITFSFKALKEGEHSISAFVSDLINSKSENLEAVSAKSSVYVSQVPVKNNSDYQTDGTEYADGDVTGNELTEENSQEGNTQIKGKDSAEMYMWFFAVLVALSLLAAVGFVCYKLGEKNKEKRKKGKDEE